MALAAAGMAARCAARPDTGAALGPSSPGDLDQLEHARNPGQPEYGCQRPDINEQVWQRCQHYDQVQLVPAGWHWRCGVAAHRHSGSAVDCCTTLKAKLVPSAPEHHPHQLFLM